MKTSTLFTNNRSQAVRLPAESRLPEGVKTVSVRVRGPERTSLPEERLGIISFFKAPRSATIFWKIGALKTIAKEKGFDAQISPSFMC